MRVQIIRPNELSLGQLNVWSRIQASNPSLSSPLFSSKFTELVGSVRPDAEVALIEDGSQIVGFFPFHRTPGDVGRPIGLRLSDLHGAIVAPTLRWYPDEVVRNCGLAAWHFDHLIASQSGFRPFHWTESLSPCMDLSEGFDPYCAARRRSGSQLISQVRRKARNIERDLGPLRFNPHSLNDRDLQQLIELKTQQHRRTGFLEVLRIPWVSQLIHKVWTTDTEAFTGMLSTLYAGNQLLAVHLGMRSQTAWHLWFPTFDRQFASYSPGLVLLLEMARAAPGLGIRRIDLGKGPERYKRSFMSGAEPLAEGSVDCRPVLRTIRRSWHEAKQWIRDSQLRTPFNTPLRVTRRFRQWLAFQ